MEKIPKRVYTKEFKEEAVKMVTEGGLSAPEVGRRLSISRATIDYWVRTSRQGPLKDTTGHREPVTDEQMELARLRQENVELRMERDILKKAAAYFTKESLPGTRS
jgi:transposase